MYIITYMNYKHNKKSLDISIKAFFFVNITIRKELIYYYIMPKQDILFMDLL